jgi:hypothetical protein
MNPSQINAVCRLVWIAKRCSARVLDDAKSFDRVVGPGRFAELDADVLKFARSVVTPPGRQTPRGGSRFGSHISEYLGPIRLLSPRHHEFQLQNSDRASNG